VPDHLPEFFVGIQATWEVDIWKKLKNRKQTAILRYLSSREGKNFLVANLVAQIANYYYDLLALDFELEAIQKTIELQEKALSIVLVQKEAGTANELAVKQFQAQTLNFRTLEVELKQQIVEIENKMNYLMGRYAQPIGRNKTAFEKNIPTVVQNGLPTQLLQNRPDIRQAELELQAAKLDVAIARAHFLPSLHIGASMGLQTFRPELLLNPASIAYSLLGGLSAPLINKNAIKANYRYANAKQVESIYQYQKTVLIAYFEAYNETIRLQNLQKMYEIKDKEVETLRLATESANDLFATGRANYLEVVFTQKNALQSQLELIILKKRQYNAMMDLYKSLGGGWR
jgi:outer membrane protein TolC